MTIPPITHDADHSRFTAQTQFGEAALEYMRDKHRMIFTHTGVPSDAEGQGIGAALAKAGLDYARSEGLTIRPMCPFVASYVQRHPEYEDLVAER
jgi:predicted GNAT family acetyltransferase